MSFSPRTLAAVVLILFLPAALPPTVSAGDKLEFQAVTNFLKVPPSVTLGRCSAVDIDSKGNIYLFHRAKPPILCFDSNGNFLRSWGDKLIHTAHGLRIDAAGNVWATDIGHHLVLKFDSKGKLLLALGQTDKPGLGNDQFNKPTDVAFAANGDVFVSDGYGNSRVMKFTATGKFIKTWGTPGKGDGQFDLPHSIVVDSKGRVLVGDRENDRVQIFDTDGKLLTIWPGFAPYGLELDKNGELFVADGRASQILHVNSSGKVAGRWGKKGKGPGEYNLPHMLAADGSGNLLVTEIGNMRLQKLVRKR